MSILFQGCNQRVFGTFPLKGDEAISTIEQAIKAGYRSIDTAQMYGNEAEVGSIIASSDVPRDELCITTKVTPGNFSEDKFIPSVEQSLKDLHLDKVDLLLLHWPDPNGNNELSLKLLEKAYKDGLASNIGISNYTSAMMREAVATVDAPIDCNQVEFHPLLNQDVLLAATVETGIVLSAYCSVARGEVFKHKEFDEIGQRYGKTAGQVVLRWIIQQGVAAITMSTKPNNIAANFDIMDFTLSSVDMGRIHALTKQDLRIVNNDLVPWAPAWD